MKSDHRRIWLQHRDDADPDMGRLWCQDKVWPDIPEDGEPTEYVRADIASDLAEALEQCAAPFDLKMGDPTEMATLVALELSRRQDIAAAALAKARGGA